MNTRREHLKECKRIVIKVGTSSLTYDTGKVNFSKFDKLARVISDLVNQGKQVILVTSGAIGVGIAKLNLKEKPALTPEKQAVAAVGQCELMHIYSKFFSEYGHIVGQILLTKDVVEDNVRKTNVINTFENLLERSIIPIVNENDSISIEEIEHIKNFGDNDTLSAIVAQLTNSDLLIILSDIDGLYDCDPRQNTCSKLISIVEEITPEIEECAGGAGTKRGTGGMVTKLSAAKIATTSGTNMVIANGSNPDIIMDVINGNEAGTLFIARKGV